MKKNPIAPIYDKLSNAEKAALAFNASLTDDKETADLIAGTVPKRNYTQTDDDFVRPLDEFYDVAMALNAEYWRLHYYDVMWLARILAEISRKKSDSANDEAVWSAKVDASIDQRKLYLFDLIALQLVTEAFADKYGIDKELLCKKVGFDTDEEVSPLDELPEHSQSYYHAMLDLITARIEKRDSSESTKEYLALN